MDWMMGGKRMMQLSCPATSVHISDPLTLQVASFTPHTSLHFFFKKPQGVAKYIDK